MVDWMVESIICCVVELLVELSGDLSRKMKKYARQTSFRDGLRRQMSTEISFLEIILVVNF